ncbi:hypothetical protein BCV70DRAFT_58685 [Testicularia cyperi]|uniref:Uncharacterized protein n=1 Tax=Testicularia cyperi TaxID=1882483 RepID=A0A317XY30_9BASI|nr:hypothetical protein BCV70DRAFT_58685 [Testicularia cyperi]
MVFLSVVFENDPLFSLFRGFTVYRRNSRASFLVFYSHFLSHTLDFIFISSGVGFNLPPSFGLLIFWYLDMA